MPSDDFLRPTKPEAGRDAMIDQDPPWGTWRATASDTRELEPGTRVLVVDYDQEYEEGALKRVTSGLYGWVVRQGDGGPGAGLTDVRLDHGPVYPNQVVTVETQHILTMDQW